MKSGFSSCLGSRCRCVCVCVCNPTFPANFCRSRKISERCQGPACQWRVRARNTLPLCPSWSHGSMPRISSPEGDRLHFPLLSTLFKRLNYVTTDQCQISPHPCDWRWADFPAFNVKMIGLCSLSSLLNQPYDYSIVDLYFIVVNLYLTDIDFGVRTGFYVRFKI